MAYQTRPTLCRLSALSLLIVGALALPGPAYASQDNQTAVAPSAPAGSTPLGVTEQLAAAGAPLAPATDGQASSSSVTDFFRTYPLPIALTLIISTATLLAAGGGVWVGLRVTPRTMREIAAGQTPIAQKAADAAATSAAAAAENAKAAGRNAEAAVRNSENVGLHEVARRRQQWIDVLRDELAQLHSLLANWVPLAGNASDAKRTAHVDRVRETNARLAKVELLLNPREVASNRLLAVLRRMNSTGFEVQKRQRLARWIIRWGQIVLKAEWDRVRAELQGLSPPQPFRRRGRR